MDDTEVHTLLNVCTAFLEYFDDADMHANCPDLSSAFTSISFVMKGLCALCSPYPALCGAGIDDVNFLLGGRVVDKNGGEWKLEADLPDVAIIITRRLQQEDVWQTRVTQFKEHAGPDAIHAPNVHKLHKTLNADLAKISADGVIVFPTINAGDEDVWGRYVGTLKAWAAAEKDCCDATQMQRYILKCVCVCVCFFLANPF
jgi:hypothetical protein